MTAREKEAKPKKGKIYCTSERNVCGEMETNFYTEGISVGDKGYFIDDESFVILEVVEAVEISGKTFKEACEGLKTASESEYISGFKVDGKCYCVSFKEIYHFKKEDTYATDIFAGSYASFLDYL